jgi:hypothetical protein
MPWAQTSQIELCTALLYSHRKIELDMIAQAQQLISDLVAPLNQQSIDKIEGLLAKLTTADSAIDLAASEDDGLIKAGPLGWSDSAGGKTLANRQNRESIRLKIATALGVPINPMATDVIAAAAGGEVTGQSNKRGRLVRS